VGVDDAWTLINTPRRRRCRGRGAFKCQCGWPRTSGVPRS